MGVPLADCLSQFIVCGNIPLLVNVMNQSWPMFSYVSPPKESRSLLDAMKSNDERGESTGHQLEEE